MPTSIWKGISLLAAAVAGFFIAVIARDSRRFVKQEYKLCSDKMIKDTVLVLLSDLHNKSYGKNNEKLLRAIRLENPDIVLTAGDMMTSDGKKTKFCVPLDLMSRLAEEYPVYYGNGNHEYRMKLYPEDYGNGYREYMDKLKKAGVTILVNERVYLPERNIEICGLEMKRLYYKRLIKRVMEPEYLYNTLGRSNPDRFELLIAHNPDYFEEYAGWGADLTVSGHVHGGVVRLPYLGGLISPMMKLFPKYDGGLFEQGDKKMVLSRGLGMHTIPVRVFNPGELVVIRLKAAK